MNTAAHAAQNPVVFIYAMLLAGVAFAIANVAAEKTLARLRTTRRGRWIAGLLSIVVATAIATALMPGPACGRGHQDQRPASKARNHNGPATQPEPQRQGDSVNSLSQPLLRFHASADTRTDIISWQTNAIVAATGVISAHNSPCIVGGGIVANCVSHTEQRRGQHHAEDQQPPIGALAQRIDSDAQHSKHQPTPSTHHVHRYFFIGGDAASIAQGGAA